MSGAPSLSFVVAEAGCESCATLVRDALEPLVRVHAIVVDEDTDTATVTADARDGLSTTEVEAALENASTGTGHRYRLVPGSWTVD